MLNLIKKLESILFYLFVISIPLEKRHIFETWASRVDDNFIEWSSASLYLSDILLALLILFWVARLLTSKYCSSEVKRSREQKLKKNTKNFFSKNPRGILFLLLLFSVFIIISLISALNSEFVKLSLYHVIKLIEYGLLFFYLVLNIKSIKRFTYTLIAFIGSALLQSVIGIIQYLKQGSIGLKIFAEVDLSPALQNISKLDIDGEKMIRAYGTLPHSNVLAGFLFIAIIFVIYLILNAEVINELPLRKKYKLPILVLVLYVIILGLFLTFSRSACLACLVSVSFIFLSIFLFKNFRKIFTKQLKNRRSWFNFFIVFVLLIGITISILWPQITSRNINANPEDEYSLSGRKLYNQIAADTIRNNLLLGVGPGLFVFNSINVSDEFQWWQLQPVHNVYLLILAEQGLLGFIAFLVFIFYILRQVGGIKFKKIDKNYANYLLIISLSSILLGFFIIMLFDHYLWDIQQGVLSLFLILGLFCSSIRIEKA